MAENVQIDDKVIERLKKWIILTENRNIRTREKGDTEMIKRIQKRIEEEVNAAEIN